MAVLSVMAIEGDADALAGKMRDTIAPVAARKAPQYGGISTTVVRTDSGIKVFNLWQTEDGRQKMAEDPEVLAAVREAGYPQPAFRAYECSTGAPPVRRARRSSGASRRRSGRSTTST